MTNDLEKSIDFDAVADVYDLHLTATFDLAFWVEEARRHPGRRLELMCGTGRISLAILYAGLSLDCVDYSAGMLSRLRAKLAHGGLAANVFERDARQLDLSDDYDYAFIGFHAFSELLTRKDQRATLRSLHRALSDGGHLTLSLQNPSVRRSQLTGEWCELGDAPIPGTDHRLTVRGRYRLDPATDRVAGVQVYQESDGSGQRVSTREVPVHFRLVDPDELVAIARSEGFELEEAWGDYDRSEFDPQSSPFFLASFARVDPTG